MKYILEKLIITSMILTLLLGLAVDLSFGVAISDIRASNYSSSSVTISWITDTITDGSVQYGLSEEELNSTEYDTRDPNPPEETISDDTHYVRIVGLQPETLYYYKVTSGEVSSVTSSFTTVKEGIGISNHTLWGNVWKKDLVGKIGEGEAEGAIVYITVTHEDKTSHRLSALVSANGRWSIKLDNLKDPETGKVFGFDEGDTINGMAQGAADGQMAFTALVSADTPQQITPDVELPVTLSAFCATATSDGMLLFWQTESEVDNLGWNIYRSTSRDEEYQRINSRLLPGAGNSAMMKQYKYIDETSEAGVTYFYYLEDVDIYGRKNKSEIIQSSDPALIQRPDLDQIQLEKQPIKLSPPISVLWQNYPNPFNPETWIPYQLAQDADVIINIFNHKGHLVQILYMGYQPAGVYTTRNKAAFWDGKDILGLKVASGVYFYTLNAGDFSASRKMVILK